jgi:hypothetical protein
MAEAIKCNIGWFCDIDCQVKYGVRKGEEARMKAIEKAYRPTRGVRKNKTKAQADNDLKVRKKAAKEACHAYIRERDKHQPCICCGKPLGDEYHAGHFLESGNNPRIRYDEHNIHGQRIDCNHFKGGDSGDYEKNLRAKVGDDIVDSLKKKKGGTLKRTPQDYMEIETYYKEKLREIKHQ